MTRSKPRCRSTYKDLVFGVILHEEDPGCLLVFIGNRRIRSKFLREIVTGQSNQLTMMITERQRRFPEESIENIHR